MEYKQFIVQAYERKPGKWRARALASIDAGAFSKHSETGDDEVG
jgi:hypothetical protein